MNRKALAPYGEALAAFQRGDEAAVLVVRRDDGLEVPLPARHFFRPPEEFTALELAALERCRGKVLDVGAGSGLHSLALAARGLEVTSLDLEPRAVEVLEARGVAGAICLDVFDYHGGPFDTLLMLGHGVGIAGGLSGLARLLERARRLLAGGGELLLDSLDVRRTEDPTHLAYHEANRRAGRYFGEIRVQFEFEGETGPWSAWLHVDPETLAEHAARSGWRCEKILEEPAGDYLASLRPRRSG